LTLLRRLRNDLYCVGWGIKLYSLAHSLIDSSEALNARLSYVLVSPQSSYSKL